MRVIKSVLALITMLAFASCSSDGDYIAVDSGSEYKVIEAGNGEIPGPEDLMLIHMENVLGDSVLLRSPAGDDFVLSATQGPAQLTDVFKLCAEGDSVHIRLKLSDYSQATRMPITSDMDTSEMVIMKMRVTKVIDRQKYNEGKQLEVAQQAEEQLETDKSIIERYLADNNLTAEKTDDGLYYVIEKAGKGRKPNNGENVHVSYTVRLLDGTFIDSSSEQLSKENNTYNPNRPYGPYKFTLGTRAVIEGWDLGIALIEKGTKAKLLVPSGLGYGPNARGDAIPANSVLIFDLELVEIEEQ